jgi:hypothetical protein
VWHQLRTKKCTHAILINQNEFLLMHKVKHTLSISKRFTLHASAMNDDALEPLIKLSWFVAHALYHHAGAGILSDSTNASSRLSSPIHGDVPEVSSSEPSRTMANLSLTGATTQRETRFSFGQGKSLNHVSLVCIPQPIY